MHALPGIVDGARKNWQGGSWIVSMPEAATSREQQYMSAANSTASYIMEE